MKIHLFRLTKHVITVKKLEDEEEFNNKVRENLIVNCKSSKFSSSVDVFIFSVGDVIPGIEAKRDDVWISARWKLKSQHVTLMTTIANKLKWNYCFMSFDIRPYLRFSFLFQMISPTRQSFNPWNLMLSLTWFLLSQPRETGNRDKEVNGLREIAWRWEKFSIRSRRSPRMRQIIALNVMQDGCDNLIETS